MTECSTSMNGPEDSPLVSTYTNHKGQIRHQCQDCMDGSNCFTCEACGNGLATQQVDHESGLREWWCSDCCKVHDTTKVGKHAWFFSERGNR